MPLLTVKQYIQAREAYCYNSQGATFQDIEAFGNVIMSSFRVCDVEMALF
jgi:hypothetical protein